MIAKRIAVYTKVGILCGLSFSLGFYISMREQAEQNLQQHEDYEKIRHLHPKIKSTTDGVLT